MLRWPTRQRFWREIPRRGLMKLLLAAGLTFSTMGFLNDIVALDSQPFSSALYTSAIASLTAVSVVLAFARDARWLIAGALIQVGGGFFLAGPAREEPWVGFTWLTSEERLQLDNLGAVVALIAGYNAFIAFIVSEGRRQVAVTAELDLARRIHENLVPSIDREIEGIAFHGVSSPSGRVGGDLVDVIDLPDGEWLAYVADVSGHGVSAGLIMGMVKSAMRMGVVDEPSLPDLVSRLNRVMCGQIAPGMYVTFAAIRGSRRGGIEVLIAGHPPMLRVVPGQQDIESVGASHVPIGIQADWAFTSTRLPFGPGDLLVLLTDGLFEVFDSADRDLGLSGVISVIDGARTLPLSAIVNGVFERARSFGPQLDDQTILLVRGGTDTADV
jgi:serine phosphatase RsbU (regulator of sigma subunit)